MATITDKRLQHSSDGTAIDYFDADVQTAQEYYAFGAPIRIRGYTATGKGNYRYGFNGKENDNEVKKDQDGNNLSGGQQDYGMRIYDPRLGRFLSVDPIGKEYPALSSYQFASNSPIAGVDRDGLEIEPYQSMRAEQSIRSYEADLHKKDPKNANAIIRQHNVDAFMFVGGALTAGSSSLFAIFNRGIMTYGGYNVFQGIKKHDADQTTNGVFMVAGSALGEVGGQALKYFIKSTAPVILDFFGGETSNIKGALNIDPAANAGFKGTIEQFIQVVKKSKIMGGVDKIVANNPYSYSDYLADAAQLLKKDGTITIRGTYGNKYFNQILKGTAKGLNEFEAVGTPTKISDALKSTMKTTEGGTIKGDVIEITLKKK